MGNPLGNVIDFNTHLQRRLQRERMQGPVSWTMTAVPAVMMPAFLVPPLMFPVAWFGFFMMAPQATRALPNEGRC